MSKAITVTIWASGDNENTPEEAVHHALSMAQKQGFIESWSEPEAAATATVGADARAAEPLPDKSANTANT